jgi:RHS repeat-associated protein
LRFFSSHRPSGTRRASAEPLSRRTPTVTYTYTRTGPIASLSGGAGGSHDFSYDTSAPWRLNHEQLGSSFGSRRLTHLYENTTGANGTLGEHSLITVKGRASGLQLGTAGTPAADLEMAYPISNQGRVAGVVSGFNGGNARTFTYGYETNSALLKSLAISGSHPFTITRVFESSRDLVSTITARWSATDRTAYAYTHDDTGRRITVVQSGDVFADYGDAIHQIFTYNTRSELTAAATFLWDAENRLVVMQTTSAAVSGGVPAQRLEFGYDHQHRRVEKKLYTGSGYSTLSSHRCFLYQGWNLLAEVNVLGGGFTLERSFVWGLDIARSLSEAGGVGALLQISDHATSKTYLPAYDGNGNVVALFDGAASGGSAGSCVAAYEYNPYGEFLRCEGSYARTNPFRFSTKFTDDETGLVYYGRRYYSPSQGRFLGRDPIEEQGGLNLYGFVGNNSINRWDYLGLTPPTFTVGGTTYQVTPIPAYLMTNQYSAAIRNQGGMWTWNPSGWGISVALVWSASSGFTLVGDISNYVYVAIPIGATQPVTPAPYVATSSSAFPQSPYNVPVSQKQADGSLAAAFSRMIPANPLRYRMAILYDLSDPGLPTLGIATGDSADARARGLQNAASDIYSSFPSVGTYAQASNTIPMLPVLRGDTWGGLIFLQHGTAAGPSIGGTLIDEALVATISTALAQNSPRVVIFAGCNAFEDPGILQLYVGWARTYNLTFIGANMDVNATIGRPLNRNGYFDPNTWIYYGITPRGQDPGFNWTVVTPWGPTYHGPDGTQTGTAPALSAPPDPGIGPEPLIRLRTN